jgi:hypothetical protein
VSTAIDTWAPRVRPSHGTPRGIAPDRGRTGVLLGAGSTAVACALAYVGGARLVGTAFPVAVSLMAVALLLRRRWYSYLSLTLIVWLLSPEIRRFVDWQSVYHDQSLISIAPSLVSLVALPWALTGRRRVHRGVATMVTISRVTMAFGLAVGVVRNGPAPAVVDVLYLVAPATTGLFVLLVPDDDGRLRGIMRALAFWGTLLLGAYSIIQFLVLPAWDAAWIVDSGVSTIGNAEPGEFRAFGTLTTTGPLGQVLAVLLLLLVAERVVARQLAAAVLGLTALGITLVRAGWIGLVLGIVVLLAHGRTRAWRVVTVILLLLMTLVAVGGPIISRVSARANETASAGTEDTSFSARLAFQSRIAPVALSDPIGDGMGSTGRAVDVSSTQPTDPKFQNFDSGVFENLTRYGALAGSALLLALVGTAAGIVRRSRTGTMFDAVCAAGIVALTFGMVFTDTLRAVYGLFLWVLIGLQGRAGATAPGTQAAQVPS